ncbi:hypothetical protein ABTD95_19295, partial [Acinetobacter baumannii]
AMAAGATVLVRDLDRFRDAIASALPARSRGEPPDPLLIDASLSAGGANVEAVLALETAGPFGQGQPEPVFAFGQHRLADARQVGQNHVRATL